MNSSSIVSYFRFFICWFIIHWNMVELRYKQYCHRHRVLTVKTKNIQYWNRNNATSELYKLAALNLFATAHLSTLVNFTAVREYRVTQKKNGHHPNLNKC